MGAYTIHRKNDINYETVGIPFNGVEIDISEPDAEGLGEIIVKNKNCMNGYFKKNGKEQKYICWIGFIQEMQVILMQMDIW